MYRNHFGMNSRIALGGFGLPSGIGAGGGFGPGSIENSDVIFWGLDDTRQVCDQMVRHENGKAWLNDVANLGTWREQEPGRCGSFDLTEKVTVPYTDATTYPITLFGRVKVNAVRSNTILSLNLSSIQYFQVMHNGTSLRLNRRSSTQNLGTNCKPGLTTGVWYSFAIIVTDATTIRCHINGVKEFDSSAQTSFNWDWAPAQLLVGTLRTADFADSTNGEIRDAGIINGTLSEADANAWTADSGFGTIPGSPDVFLKLDEGSGTTAFDSSGNGNDGTITATSISTFHNGTENDEHSWQDDQGFTPPQPAYDFDGSGDFATASGPTGVTFPFTLFTRFMGSDGGLPTGNQSFITIHKSSNEFFSIGVINARAIATLRKNTAFLANSTGTLAVSGWNSVAMVFEDEDHVRVHHNGAKIYDNNSLGVAPIITNPTDLYLGQLYASTYRVNTQLKDCGFYNGTISEADANTWTSELTGEPPNVDIFYPCNEGEGPYAIDSQGSNDATITATDLTFDSVHVTAGPRIPRDESDTANDIYGQPLEYSGRVPGSPQLISMPCATFDGSLDKASASPPSQTTGSWLCRYYPHVNDTSFRQLVGVRVNLALFHRNNHLMAYDWDTTTANECISEVSLNEWHSACLTFDDGVADGAKVYFDGKLEKTFTYNDNSSAENFMIGSNVNNQNFDGSICDVLAYERVLTAQEVSDWHLYGTIPTGPVRYYPCADQDGTTIYDVTNNADMTITTVSTATFWGTTQDHFDYLTRYGAYLTGSTYVPGNFNEDGNAADGSAINRGPCKLIGSTQLVTLPEPNAPWALRSGSIVSPYDVGDGNNGAELFARTVLNDGDDRFIIVDPDATEPDLTNLTDHTA